MKNTFGKSEKLTSKIVMEEIFSKGETLKQYPLILKYLTYDFKDKVPAKIVISVPKRKVKRAVHRNRVRRQLKEAYRLNKKPLFDLLKSSNTSLALFFIYTGEENQEYSFLEKKIKLLLKKAEQNLTKALK